MATNSSIEWTEQTWNPTTGCTKISSGCKNCYAETMAKRLQAMGAHGYENGFNLSILPERLSQPLKRKKPTVNLDGSFCWFPTKASNIQSVTLALRCRQGGKSVASALNTCSGRFN